MKFKTGFHFRKFNKEEDDDSGYYHPFDSRRISKVDVRSDDEAFEQVLTIYHEITHLVLDLLTQYELDDQKAKPIKRPPKLRDDWRDYNEKTEKASKDDLSREEIICAKVEQAVKAVLQKEIPKRFFKKMFTKSKKVRIIKQGRKRRK